MQQCWHDGWHAWRRSCAFRKVDRLAARWHEATNAHSSMVLSTAGRTAGAKDEWFESAVRTFNSKCVSAARSSRIEPLGRPAWPPKRLEGQSVVVSRPRPACNRSSLHSLSRALRWRSWPSFFRARLFFSGWSGAQGAHLDHARRHCLPPRILFSSMLGWPAHWARGSVPRCLGDDSHSVCRGGGEQRLREWFSWRRGGLKWQAGSIGAERGGDV